MTDVSQAALEIGKNVGIILVTVANVPAILTAPIIALASWGSFLFGKKYERKWAKKNQVSIQYIPEEQTLEPEEQSNVSDSQ